MRPSDPPGASAPAGPVFAVRRAGERVVTDGLPACRFGHRIPRAPGARPDGVHAEWRWDGQCLRAENDRFGVFPLFYFAAEDRFAISPSIPALLAAGAPAELDWPGLAVFLRIGFFVGEDTAFRAIRALPPDATLQWRPGRLELRGGYVFPRPERMGRPAAIEGFVDRFRAAIARRLPTSEEFAVPLSGGRDSRHILLELCAQGRPPRFCITGRRFPPASTEDERIAAVVAAAVGVEHVVVGPPRGQVRSLVEANLRTNLTAPRRGWKLAVAEHLRGTVRASYDGIGGDMLAAGATLDPAGVALMEAGRYREYARSLFRNADAALRRLLPPPAWALMDGEVATARLEAELVRHAEAPNPSTSFAFWNRTRRFNGTSPYGIYRDLPTVYSPFLDHDLWDFMVSLPAGLLLDHGLHDEAIRAAYPRHAALPYESAEAPPSRNRGRSLATTGELAAFLLRHRPRRLLDAGYLLPRLAAGALTLGTVTGPAWSLPLVVYLAQLEAIARAHGAPWPDGARA
jgi:hypothetical protein